MGIECKKDDHKILKIIDVLNHEETNKRCLAERSFLRELEGGCQVPIGVNSEVKDDLICLRGMVASIDGKRLIKDYSEGDINEPEKIGKILASKLKNKGAGEILNEIFDKFR